jgi:Zn finger protein HypA/HybF involved in hydrogenase expression
MKQSPKMPTNKTIQLSFGDTYDEVRHLLDSNDWRIMDAEALMKCNDCHYQSREYAEHDDLIELVGLEQEEHCQVRCPKCKSWYYWEQDAGSK